MKRQQIAHFSYVNNNETFTADYDDMEYNLKEWLLAHPYAYFRSGVWNDYKRADMEKAISDCKSKPWGADIYIEYNEDWEMGKMDGKCNVYFSCPCNSDMW